MSPPDTSANSTCAASGRKNAFPIPARRGVTVLIVLLLLSITLGLSYAIVRSQTTALRVQQNANVRASARRAALTGLTVALKEMHTDEWCDGDGVNTTLSGWISDCERYQVTYAAGDPSLAVDDPDYPYRVTLLSTGTASDKSDPDRTTTHRARAVVRLAPRSVADEPSDWAAMQQYTVYQSKKDTFDIDIPCRLEGKVRIQGWLHIAPNYPTDEDAWQGYLADLKSMADHPAYPDYRPLSRRPVLDHSLQTPQDRDALSRLGLWKPWYVSTPTDETEPDWALPSSCSEYQIYPGGPVYEVPALGARVDGPVLGPDPETNPLGLFQRVGNLVIGEGVTVRGSLFCSGRINIEGENVHFEPVELPAVNDPTGPAVPLRLPAASCKWLTVKPTASGSVTGLVAVFEELKVKKSPDTVEFGITGRVVTRRLTLKEREPWQAADWDAYYDQFKSDPRYLLRFVVPYYFPVWMADRGYDPRPRLTIGPDPSDVAYHWKKPYDPIYVPHPDDDGLRWDLLEWTDGL